MHHAVHSHHTANAGNTQATHQDAPKASRADHAMYLGMMALLESIAGIELTGASVADLSKTLYDTLVKNGMNKLQEMQEELSALSFLQHNFTAFQAYAKWKNDVDTDRKNANDPSLPANVRQKFQSALNKLSGHAPKIATNDPDLINRCMGEMGKFNSLTSLKGYANSLSQQIGSENLYIQNNKQIPDAMQAQVRTLTNAQGQLAAEISSFLGLMQDQLRYSK